MYDELVKRLRYRADREDDYYKHGGDIINEAADAIEELSKPRIISIDHQLSEEEIERLHKEIANIPIVLIPEEEELSKPRWIPVTERLPEKNQIVVVHEGKGTWDFGMFRGISASGNPEYWHWKKNTFKHVKWWMPKDGALPDPPKEEI